MLDIDSFTMSVLREITIKIWKIITRILNTNVDKRNIQKLTLATSYFGENSPSIAKNTSSVPSQILRYIAAIFQWSF